MNRLRQTFFLSAMLVIFPIILLTPFTGPILFPTQISRVLAGATQTTTSDVTVQNSVDALVAASDVVVRGRVQDQSSFWNANHSAILTDSRVNVLYGVIGPTPQTVSVRTLGGELPDEGIGMGASHAPALHPGEDVVLYLQQDGTQFTISQGEAGKFVVHGQDVFNEHLAAGVPLTDLLDATVAVAAPQAKKTTLPAGWQMREAQAGLAPAAVTTHSYNGVHWPGDNPVIPFYVNPVSAQSGPGDGSQADFLNAIWAATNTWTDVNSAAFTFDYAGTTSQQAVGFNGVNEVMFIDQGAENSIVGQAHCWYALPSKEIVEADVWFNDAFDFDATGSPGSAEVDLQSVALHEFGHWLILEHDDNPAAIMYYIMTTGTLKRNLHQADVDGISAVYPCPNNACGAAPTSTFTPTATNTPLPPTPISTPTATNTPLPTPTATGTIPPVPTPTASVQVGDASSQGGSITYYDANGDMALTLDIPSGAVDGTVLLAYAEIAETPQPPTLNDQFAGRRFELHALQNGESDEHYVFTTPVMFTLTYPELAGLDEESLMLFYFDETLQLWVSASCGEVRRALVDNEISVEVRHLSEFALFSRQEQEGSRFFLPVVCR